MNMNLAATLTAVVPLLFAVGYVSAVADDRLLRTNSGHMLQHHASLKSSSSCNDWSVGASRTTSADGKKERQRCNDVHHALNNRKKACEVEETTFGFDCKSATPGPNDENSIVAIQWSPHWKCFALFADTCQPEVINTMIQFHEDLRPDFMNVGMMGESAVDELRQSLYTNMRELSSGECSNDKVDLWYNHQEWELEEGYDEDEEDDQADGASSVLKDGILKGCLQVTPDDRAIVGAIFHRKLNTQDRILVFGVHLPHPHGGTSSSEGATFDDRGLAKLGTRVEKILKKASNRKNIKVLIIGDFNYDAPQTTKRYTEAGKEVGRWTPKNLSKEDGKSAVQPVMSSEDIWEKMGLKSTPTLGSATEDAPTCCADMKLPISVGAADKFELTGKEKGGEIFFPFAFDRILSSDGTMTTMFPLGGKDTSVEHSKGKYLEHLFVGAFHKPIMGILEYSSNILSE